MHAYCCAVPHSFRVVQALEMRGSSNSSSNKFIKLAVTLQEVMRNVPETLRL
jgi:hypothetical protein